MIFGFLFSKKAKKILSVGKANIISNDIVYDLESSLMKRFTSSMNKYKNYLEVSKKTDEETNLEKLGLTSSKNYTYSLNNTDEDAMEFILTYKSKYPNNIFISTRVFDEMKLKKIAKKDVNCIIPKNIVDVLFKFKIDFEDYKIFEHNGGYVPSWNFLEESIFSYNDVIEALHSYWTHTDNIRNDYIKALNKGEFAYIGSTNVMPINKLQIKGIEKTYVIKTHYKAEKDFFFVMSKSENKLSFKNFIQNVEIEEFVAMQPVKGGYLIMANW